TKGVALFSPAHRWMNLAAVILLFSATAALRADEPASRPSTQPGFPDTFMQFVDDGHGGGTFQTAEVAFQNSAGVTVTLIGAIHIGEQSYYDALNTEFQSYDAVLYEMIKPKDAPPPAPGDDGPSSGHGEMSAVHNFQRMLKDTLQLDYQLDDIDYTAPNFIHADMDIDTFEQMQAQRGESFETLMFQQIMNSLENPPKDESEEQSWEDLVHMVASPDMERQIKVVIARQLGDMDTAAMGLDGPGGTVIVSERNKACLKVLSDTIASGKKNIAIFYGAAHMPDMSRRLEEMGFTPLSTKWNSAWNLTIRADQPSAFHLIMDKLFSGAATQPANKSE
ncbi:MAG: hypothetical protein ABSG31_13700, partial [Tepidisphaeraceae bacterium]